MVDKKLETLAYRLRDLSTLRNLFSELNFDFADKPVNKDNWNDEQKRIVQEAKIIASKDDYQIYYIQTNTDSLKEWKGVSSKIIKDNNGLCMICSHNPRGFKWVFSSLSKDFSKSFSETRHVPIDINPDTGVPNTFVEFLEKIKVEKNSTSTSIASQISDAFDSFAVQIHDELTVNVFEALKVLSEGIVVDKNNNLPLTDETLEEIREPIFILLYRIIFILYAEDRGIFPADNKIYQDEFSLKWIKEKWLLKSVNIKKLAEFDVEKRIKKLFRLIEIGSEELDYDKDEFFMRSYYGRIFDRKINNKLEEWNIPNSNFLEMLSLLTRTKDKKGNYFFLDYSALETRHLGSIYEHLLEYHLIVKNKKIADLPNSRERKTTGSYYTPKFIVDYIVRNSIEPVIESIIEKNPDKQSQIEKILSLKILDPAMGSGHFLVGVVDYIARRLCEIEFGEVIIQECIERKRDVVRRCIYGVDLNPLAVDLAKVSLWLETLSSDKPLSFLSAHLKTGNSLIGESVNSVFDAQRSLFETKAMSHFKKTVKDFLGFETLEDDTASAVKAKVEKYKKMQEKGTYHHQLRGILDHKTAEFFGKKITPWRDLRQKIGVESLDFYANNSGSSVFEIRNNSNFFHWELEFPEIFFNENGQMKENEGFDIVIGNPPYVKISTISNTEKNFLYKNFSSASGRADTYILFIEKALKLLKKDGYFSFITPNKFAKAKNGEELRKIILENFSLKEFIDFGDLKVFGNKTTYPCITLIKNSSQSLTKSYNINVKKISSNLMDTISKNRTKAEYTDEHIDVIEFDQNDLNSNSWNFIPRELNEIFLKINKNSKLRLNDLQEMIYEGFVSGDNDSYFFNSREIKQHNLEEEIIKPVPKGRNVKSFKNNWNDRYVLFPYINKNNKTQVIKLNDFPNTKKYFEGIKKKLETRKSLQGSNKNWYEMIRPREFFWYEQDKIICPSITDKNNFCIDFKDNPTKKYFFVDHDCYGVVLKDKNKKNYLYVLSILNSNISEFFLKQKSPKYSGGYYLYQSQYLEQIPFPKINDKTKYSLIKIVESLLCEKNIEIIKELKIEMNEIIYNLFKINDAEKKLIENIL